MQLSPGAVRIMNMTPEERKEFDKAGNRGAIRFLIGFLVAVSGFTAWCLIENLIH